MKSKRSATIHNARLYVWFDPGPDGDREARACFEALGEMLAASGFTVGPCAKTAKQYPSLADTRQVGSHGALRVKLGYFGRTAEADFWSEERALNPNGGEYDFDRVERMPYPTRKRWEWTRTRLLALLHAWSIPLRRKRHVYEGASPLDDFNDGWGADRFPRKPDGWPTEKELNCWRREDADGVPVHNGQLRFVQVRGRWVSCCVYGGINGMWLCVSNGRLLDNVNVHALRSTFPGPGRHFAAWDREQTMERHLARAVNEKQFLRAHALSAALETLKGKVAA